jgi:lipid-binding SYLF domain-containing protein
MTTHRSTSALLCVLLALIVGVGPAYAASKEDKKRDEVRETRDKTLAELYKEKPSTKESIAKAAGYAVFSNITVSFLLSGGGGTGMAVDAQGNETFMNMGTAGVGIGFGVKDFRAVFIFHDKDKLAKFIESGWDFSGQADAAAKSDDKGAQASGAGTVVEGVELYQFTKTGLALQASLQGTKYWKDKELNAK